MNKMIYVGGTAKGVGKTFVALGLIHNLIKHRQVGAWKPVDVGHIVYNAADVPTDGERLHETAQMAEHANLCNPYLFNEDFPSVFAALRDGVKVETKVLRQYWSLLSQRFEWVVTEGARGLFSPLTETDTEMDLLCAWKPKLIWVTAIGSREFHDTLVQVKALQHAKVPLVGILLTNAHNAKDANLMHYQWVHLEEQLSIRVLGLLPFLKSGLDDPAAIGALMHENMDANYLNLLTEEP